jgi:uncharacterized protein
LDTSLLTEDEKRTLLRLARAALEESVRAKRLSALDLSSLTPPLRAHGASFVTLTLSGALRGCVGTLTARQPLAEDVRQQAVAAAQQDFRFAPVTEGELNGIRIEVSRLTDPVALVYASPEELRTKIRPHVDGVILNTGTRRATYLPQVWDKLPDPALFLGSLCEKLGADADLWRRTLLSVQTYQVEAFHESLPA